MKVRPTALLAADLLLLSAGNLSEGCDVLAHKTAVIASPVKHFSCTNRQRLELAKLRGGSTGPRGVVYRQCQKETNRFLAVNAIVYLGLLVAMTKTGVEQFVPAVNIGVTVMWWVVALAGKPIKSLFQAIFGHKEKNAFRCDDLVGDDEHVIVIKVQRGNTLEWPDDLICVGVDNGWTDAERSMLDQADTEEKARYLMKRRPKTITLKFVKERSVISFVHKKAAEDTAQDFMEKYFLQSQDWRQLRKQPFSMFGAAFSHIDIAHLSANLSTFSTFSRYAVQRLGNFKFALLYLFCIFSSTAFDCLSLGTKEGKSGLGASGAITGVVSWWCFSMNLVDGRALTVKGKKVNPLVVLLIYVLQDALGLFRLNGTEVHPSLVTLLVQLVKDEFGLDMGELGLETDNHKQDKNKPKEHVGYAAHIGGYLGGMIFFALNLACESVPVYLAELRSRFYR